MYKDCPKPKQQATGKGIYGPSKGGGKGHKGKGKGVNELSDWAWPDDSSPILLGQSMAIREVCLAKEAQQEENEHATRSTVTLGDFVVKENKRKTRRKTRNIRNVADETLGSAVVNRYLLDGADSLDRVQPQHDVLCRCALCQYHLPRLGLVDL